MLHCLLAKIPNHAHTQHICFLLSSATQVTFKRILRIWIEKISVLEFHPNTLEF